MLVFGQDPYEMRDPIHQCPEVMAALRQEEPADDPAPDDMVEDALLKRHLGRARAKTLTQAA